MKVKCICKQCGKEFYPHACYVKRGQGKFCSISCGVTYRNLTNNPAKNIEVRRKISANHADVSGIKNPMYGVRGKDAPAYIDGRSKYACETYRKILKASGIKERCVVCGIADSLHVHHVDGNHKNNDINNLCWVCAKCHNTVMHQYSRDKLGRFISSKLSKECFSNDIQNMP